MEVIYIALAIVACVFLFSFAVFVHEFGHFVAAKMLGFKVEVFSIGFGPALWKKTYKGVEYRISAIPFGGYVALPQLDPEGTKALENGNSRTEDGGSAEASAEGASPATPIRRIIVAFAGPFGNMVLALILALMLAAAPGARFGEVPAEIGGVIERGPAAEGGMKAGDKVLSVNGRAVRSWSEMQTEVQIAGTSPATFVVDRGGERKSLTIVPRRDKATDACFILALGTTNNFVKAAAWMPDRNPLRQLAWDAGQIARVLKALCTPRESKAAAKALGGPVLIAESLYRQVRRNGWDAIGFLRFLNINLAILNLLPIPVLDGGLIFFALFELLVRRKPPKKLVDGLSVVFMWLFLSLMVFLVFRDVRRSSSIHRAERDLGRRLQLERNEIERVKNFRPAFDMK
jgi:regulator of sigma E protease